MIGIIDSGVGGLAIYRGVKAVLPDMKVLYLADAANFPYGEKSQTELFQIVDEATRKLIDQGAKAVILACNTATVATIADLRKKYSIPFIGVEPAVKLAAKESENGQIGLIATKRTIKDHQNGDLILENQVVNKSFKPDLVEKIENQFHFIDDEYIEASIKDLIDKKVDSVVLGCTHYIFLKERYEQIFPEIKFYEPTEAIVKRLLEIVKEHKIVLETGQDVFYTTGDTGSFKEKIKDLLGEGNADVRKV